MVKQPSGCFRGSTRGNLVDRRLHECTGVGEGSTTCRCAEFTSVGFMPAQRQPSS